MWSSLKTDRVHTALKATPAFEEITCPGPEEQLINDNLTENRGSGAAKVAPFVELNGFRVVHKCCLLSEMD